MSNLSILSTEIRQVEDLYCLNDLYKASGKSKKHQPANFLRAEQTQELITEIERFSDMSNEAIPVIKSGIERSSDMRNEAVRVIQGGVAKNQGTYACKEIVYSYAMWVSAKFQLTVIRAFDKHPPLPEKPLQLPQRLTPAQQHHIQMRIKQLVAEQIGTSYPALYGQIKRQFRVGTYKDVESSRYPQLCKFLDCDPQPDITTDITTIARDQLPATQEYTLEDETKYQMLNAMIKQMDFKDEPVIVPYIDLTNITKKLRGVQAGYSALQSMTNNAEYFISNMKKLTGKNLLDI